MPLAIDNILLPSTVQVESVGALRSDTAIDSSDGGIEQRNAWLPITPERFILKFGAAYAATVKTLFRTQRGPLRAFLIDDLDDNVLSNVELENVTSGGVTKCQLRQRYSVNSVYTGSPVRTVYRPVYRLGVGATLTITVDDVPTLHGYGDDGVITFDDVITGSIKATLSKFYKVVRFEDDELTITRKMGDIREIQSCRVISLLFPSQIIADGNGGGGDPLNPQPPPFVEFVEEA